MIRCRCRLLAMSMESSVNRSSWPAMSSARYPSAFFSAITPPFSHPTYPLGKSRPCSTYRPAQLPSISSPGTTLGELKTTRLSCWLGPGLSLLIMIFMLMFLYISVSQGGCRDTFGCRKLLQSLFLLTFYRKELNSMTLPEEWYKGIMEFSAEDSSHGSLMIAWIGGIAAKVADTLPDDQVCDVTLTF